VSLDTKNLLSNIPDWKQMLNLVGRKGIVQNIPFILYCTALGLIYITINHYAENTIRNLNKTAKDLKEDRWKYIDEKSQLMRITKESELAVRAASIGLDITRVPPNKILITLNEYESK
jgi:hypothetical protein